MRCPHAGTDYVEPTVGTLIRVSCYYYLYYREYRLPHFPALYASVCTQRGCGVQKTAPCGDQPYEGAPNKFCASRTRFRSRGGAAMGTGPWELHFP